MLHIAWIGLLVLLPLPWIVRRWLSPAPAPIDDAVYAPFAGALSNAAAQVKPSLGGRDPLIGWLALVCWLLLMLAAIRPQWLGQALELPESGRNVLLAVDVSGSMEATDLGAGKGTRLDVVKQVAGEFIQRRTGDRIGLILFGSQAYLQAPLTLDRAAVADLLNGAAVGIAGRHTAIGDAIGMALKRLREGVGETVLILLTDGANTAGHVAPSKAAQLAAEQGLRIHTIGVGGKPQQVQTLFGPRMRNPAADLDEATLKNIAATTGGRYFRATDRASLEDIYRQLDDMEPVAGDSRTVRPVQELYPWPLGAALVLSFVLATLAYYRGLGT